jgi:hypothetical protein
MIDDLQIAIREEKTCPHHMRSSGAGYDALRRIELNG